MCAVCRCACIGCNILYVITGFFPVLCVSLCSDRAFNAWLGPCMDGDEGGSALLYWTAFMRGWSSAEVQQRALRLAWGEPQGRLEPSPQRSDIGWEPLDVIDSECCIGSHAARSLVRPLQAVMRMNPQQVERTDRHGATLLHVVAHLQEENNACAMHLLYQLLRRQADVSRKLMTSMRERPALPKYGSMHVGDTPIDIAQRRGNVKMVAMMQSALQFRASLVPTPAFFNPAPAPQQQRQQQANAESIPLAASVCKRLQRLINASEDLAAKFEKSGGGTVTDRFCSALQPLLARHLGGENWSAFDEDTADFIVLSIAQSIQTELSSECRLRMMLRRSAQCWAMQC